MTLTGLALLQLLKVCYETTHSKLYLFHLSQSDVQIAEPDNDQVPSVAEEGVEITEGKCLSFRAFCFVTCLTFFN